MSRAVVAGRAAEWLQLAGLLALLGVFYFVVVPAGIEDPAEMGFDQGLPPSFSARAAAIVAGLILVGRMVQLLLVRPSQAGSSGAGPDLPRPSAADDAESDAVVLTGRVAGGIAAALVFAYGLLPQLGFIPASLILLISLLLMLGERLLFRLLVLPVLVTIGVWLLFVQALGVALPTGVLFDALLAG